MTTYTVDTKKSTIQWTGRKVMTTHTGTVALVSGKFTVDENKITGGLFEIDMSTIVDNDQSGDMKAMLEKHLKSEDFFAVQQFPKAVLRLIEGSIAGGKAAVTAQLTIKGKTHNVSLDATIKQQHGIVADATLSIDRSLWDVRYGSGKFFKGLGDKLISDDIEFTIHIVAV